MNDILEAPAKPAKKSTPAAAAPQASELGQGAFASIAWHRVGEAEAVIRAYAKDSGSEEAWAILTIVEVATGILSCIHEAPGATDCRNASNFLAQAIAVGSLVTDDAPDLLLDAGLTILVLAKDILDKGREELPHA